MNDSVPAITICSIIEVLYVEAVIDNDIPRLFKLRAVYHMAKKMNRKLIEYKTGIVETWTEAEVDGRLEELAEIGRKMRET